RRLDQSILPIDERPLARALRSDAFVDAQMLLITDDGKAHRLTASGASTVDRGKVNLAIVVIRDVTEQQELEARFARSERLAAIGTLSAGMAHEINNPLAYIVGNVEYALEAIPELRDRILALGGEECAAVAARLSEVGDALAEAQEGGLRVRRIVRDVSYFGGLDRAERSVLELTEVIEGAIRMTEGVVRRNAVLRREYEWSPLIKVNVSQLGQVFVNLLMNAAQAIGEGSPETNDIVVAVFSDSSGNAVAEIRDSGPGISRDIQRRIFDPFFTTKAVGQGSGLGLSICHSILRSFGGQISVDSTLGKGATFRVTLPPAAERPSEKLLIEARPAPIRRGRILVIDDEPALCRSLTRTLQRDHDVLTFTDARYALALLATDDTFDIILCDLMMPEMTGVDFYEKLHATNDKLARRVVFLTGGACTRESQEFLRDRKNATLMKPIDSKALLRIVAEALGTPTSSAKVIGK
ncbi:MAG: ATP-binding protein, partial [Polyangiaceae bacterium]